MSTPGVIGYFRRGSPSVSRFRGCLGVARGRRIAGAVPVGPAPIRGRRL